MKQNETLLNTTDRDIHIDEIGDNHIGNTLSSPIRSDAFEIADDLKIGLIEQHFAEIMNILGLDLNDDSLNGTPRRVAKMYVQEIFSGLNPKNKPKMTLFENKYDYKEMLVEKDITLFSCCEHHFQPFYGKAHVAYKSTGQVIGLSKLNRIVQYYAQRPQLQERLTKQIADELKSVLKTDHVAVVIEAHHMCVSTRGVKDHGSSTITADYHGDFLSNSQTRNEFLGYIRKK